NRAHSRPNRVGTGNLCCKICLSRLARQLRLRRQFRRARKKPASIGDNDGARSQRLLDLVHRDGVGGPFDAAFLSSTMTSSPYYNLAVRRVVGTMEGRMSSSTIALQEPRSAIVGRLCDYIELTKPRIAVLELVVVLAAGVVATWGQPSPALLLHAMFGTLL